MKRLFAIAVAAALLVGITALAYGAGKGPAKATGGVGTTDNGWRASFNAHEGSPFPEGKGRMQMSSNIAGRSLHLVVKYVNVDDVDGDGDNETAWFAAKVTLDSNLGAPLVNRWFYVKVVDGGSPGPGNDEIWWDWDTKDEKHANDRVGVSTPDDPKHRKTITNGNLVVH